MSSDTIFLEDKKQIQTIYWFKELSKESTPIAGGKGANLGEMTSAGFPVPPGFVVSADAYFEFLKTNNLYDVIARYTGNLDVRDNLALNAAGSAIRQAILQARMPQDLEADMTRAYNRLCGVDLPAESQEVYVAVRSSATSEDGAEASFAGQNETYLNVKGSSALSQAVKKCWASLFGARSIYYRQEQGFDHLKNGMSVVVQEMVQSERSGVMFSVDPVTRDRTKIIIEAGLGLGEAVVSGSISPDYFEVSKQTMQITRKRLSKQEKMITRVGESNQWVEVPEELQEAQKITDQQAIGLADYAMKMEEHYGKPQDMEWAINSNGDLMIVQTRPVTTLNDKKPQPVAATQPVQSQNIMQSAQPTGIINAEKYNEQSDNSMNSNQYTQNSNSNDSNTEATEEILLEGLPASPGIASGPVCIIKDLNELYKVKKGDVLVTEMTTPDFVPAMKRAIAIVTDQGGSTCHAAIVSRELGIPCIVGTTHATQTLKDGQVITVDANHGNVFSGSLTQDEKTNEAHRVETPVGTSGGAIITGTKLYCILSQTETSDKVSQMDLDGVGLLRAEFIIAGLGKHPMQYAKEGKQQEFIDHLAKHLRKVCAAFDGKPIIYRANDFKTNEYKNLEGGAEFEPHEENPMIGFRGCFRYIKDPTIFNMELAAIKKVREVYKMRNLHLMIPMVRTIHEFKQIKRLVEASGLYQTRDFKLGMMCEVPSNVILAEEFCKAGTDFMSIGSNDLTQMTLGIDRDNPLVAEEFDERDEAILASVKHAIETCHKYGVTIGICGQAPSVYPEFTEKLVEYGIDSISVNPDMIQKTRRTIAQAEKKKLLKH